MRRCVPSGHGTEQGHGASLTTKDRALGPTRAVAALRELNMNEKTAMIKTTCDCQCF